MSLLLLFLPVAPEITLSVNVTASSSLSANARNATQKPSAEVNAFGSMSAAMDLRSPAQAAALIPAQAVVVAGLSSATERLTALVSCDSAVQAEIASATARLTADVAAESSADGSLRNSSQYAAAAIAAVSDLFVRIPPRSIGGVAGSASGRTATGSLTGGGRGLVGTATSAGGRSTAGSPSTGGSRGHAGTASPASGRNT